MSLEQSMKWDPQMSLEQSMKWDPQMSLEQSMKWDPQMSLEQMMKLSPPVFPGQTKKWVRLNLRKPQRWWSTSPIEMEDREHPL
jgi:hypothetical protein